MKNFKIYFVILSLALISSCDEGLECNRVSTNIISETRDLKDFKGVVFSNQGNIVLTQGSEYSFTIKGPDNVVEFTNTTIEDELLVISSNTCFNGDYDLDIEITAPEYRYINLAGAGSIKTVNQLDGDILVMEMMGVGDIEADVYVDSLYTTISGTGTVNFTGEAYTHEVSSSGSFTLNSYDLETVNTKINITGEGYSYVLVNETLSVLITGIGTVYYKGNPTIDKDITGTGEVIDDN